MTTSLSSVIAGHLDGATSTDGLGYVRDRFVAVPGRPVFVRGWAFDRRGGPLTIDVMLAGSRARAELNADRADVVEEQGARSRSSGFQCIIDAPEALPASGVLRVVARTGDGQSRELLPEREYLALAAEIPAFDFTAATAFGRVRELRDSNTDEYPLGWRSGRTIRTGMALFTQGWIASADGVADEFAIILRGASRSAVFPAERVFDTEASALHPDLDFRRTGFRVVADARGMPPGLYDLTVAGRFGDGWRGGPATIVQIAPPSPERASSYLPVAYQPAPHAIERCAPLDPVRGEPIAIVGWAIDPASQRGGRTFIAFDDFPPMPLASCLSRPDRDGAAIGFSGIADTADLVPGEHMLRILLLHGGSACWYELERKPVTVRAQRLADDDG